ncbi:galactose-binding domain-containing protein [Cohnella mopanensis]|uniref:galactose-binding domain-containing protein n=1 Tax=Cohnella mopanensis TaxID=2911966 RepID=UPI001EF8859E|nr:discoidin domain-containing protein [Cohnella mopanensis]
MQPTTRNIRKALFRTTSLVLILSLLLSIAEIVPLGKVHAAGSYLLSLDRTAYASSTEGNNTPDLATDGNTGSRWSSAWGADPQWIYIDLGASAAIDQVIIRWEGAYAKSYKIQVSNDESAWTDVYATTAGHGGVDTLSLTGNGRYVRLLCTERFLAQYGVSVFEFEVYGTGGANPPPVALGPNVALNKPVTASSYEQSAYLPPGSTLPQNAVDGNAATRWSSNPADGEWIYVDLGSVRTIGRIRIQWEAAAGRAYDIQVSNNASSWTTVYRELTGDGGLKDLPVYTSGRYVRMKGISRATSFGYSIFELSVYDYVAGDPQPSYTIPALPTPATIAAGQGSYYTNDISMPQPKYPLYKNANITAPLPSNDWWQSILIKKLGDGIITLPLKSKYTKQGLSVLNSGAGWVNGRSQEAGGNPDLYLMASNIGTSAMSNKIIAYGDWSATVSLSDNSVDKMKTTFVKGSPYLYSEFSDPTTPELYLPASTRFFDDGNNAILATDGTTITGDHIGFSVTNLNGAPTPSTVTRHYGVFAPAGTTFKRVGSKIKIQLGGGQNYLSLATLPAVSDLNYFYQHAYAFVTNTTVTPGFNPTTSDVTTTFNVTTSQKRTGFPTTTLMALLPHQWKITTSPLTALTYPSIRGTLKLRDGNTFTTVDRFYGIVPQFTEPSDPTYSRQSLLQYLALLDQDTSANLMKADAYWQGKVLHPLAMGVLIADQIGDANYKSLFLGRMKTVLSDWYTYTQGEPSYFLYYDPTWGTMYYKESEFGANTGITDHHFTYGYYVFASAVLATYDQDFKDKYSTMVEHLIRDYANPSKTDPLYPFFRNFDPYEGHSWAGGYGDNDSGNNQEAAGESLFGWVGQYMWSMLTGNTAYRDASVYGFTTELKAVEQYWFNYDNDNWHPDYPYKTAGQVYGSSNFFGTFFNGDPVYVYGIHWLPTSEYLTSYGFDPAKAAALYNGFVKDNGGPETDWYHIVWPIQSLSNPQAVLSKWNTAGMQKNEVFNTYWFVHNMATLGQRTKDIWATGWSSATVYKNGANYSALVWNPTNAPVTVTFRNATGVTGTATVAAKSLTKVNPTNNSNPGLLTPPALVADTTLNAVGQPIELTFADNAAWRGAISSVKVNGATVGAGQYAIAAGKLTLNAVLFGQAGSYAITVQAVGYSDAAVTQTIIPSGGTGGSNLALNKPTASSANPLQVSALAVDGNAGSRWESAFSDPQWISVDLGAATMVNRVVLNWEPAYATSYSIQVSTDGTTWTNVYSTTTGDGGIDDISFPPVSARYVKMNGTVRGTPYGYSLWEFEVYGGSATLPSPQLTADTTLNQVGQPIEITFADNTAWRSAIQAVSLNGTAIGASQFSVAAGKLTLSASLFAQTGNYAITVQASGYTDASVQQAIVAGQAINLALQKTTATSANPISGGIYAVDGDSGTRWESAYSDPQWISVDLGTPATISRVYLNWEGAYAKSYSIEVSANGTAWTTVYSTTTGDGGIDNVTFTPVNAKIVRLTGTQRGTQYGYSLWDLEVYP